VPRKGKGHGLKIFQRFHFSSTLKRMSVIAGYTPPGSTDVDYIVTVKGAPEVLKNMVSISTTRGTQEHGEYFHHQKYSRTWSVFPPLEVLKNMASISTRRRCSSQYYTSCCCCCCCYHRHLLVALVKLHVNNCCFPVRSVYVVC